MNLSKERGKEEVRGSESHLSKEGGKEEVRGSESL